jgi:hypothetical protein
MNIFFISIFFVSIIAYSQDKSIPQNHIGDYIVSDNTELIYSDKYEDVVHIYLLKEAFQLLKLCLDNREEITEMDFHLGENETMPAKGLMSLGYLNMVSGSYVEDHFDIVYWYGLLGLKPAGSYKPDWLAFFEDIFMDPNDKRGAFTSVTHFWDADKGVEYYTRLSDNGTYEGDLGSVSFSFDIHSIPNAYMKALKYINGYYSEMWCSDGESLFKIGNVETTHFAWKRNFSIFDIYNGANIKMYLKGFTDVLEGVWEDADDSSSDAEPNYYWNLSDITWHKNWAYHILGRICHLLQDMSIPVHVHNVSHGAKHGQYEDEYESLLTSSYIQNLGINAESIYKNGHSFIDPYLSGLCESQKNPIQYLFYCQNQIADILSDGKIEGDILYDSDYYGLEKMVDEISNFSTVIEKRKYLLTSSIQFTAGLLYWFLVETGQLGKIDYYQNGGYIANSLYAENSIYVRNISSNTTFTAGNDINIIHNSSLLPGFKTHLFKKEAGN